MSFCSSPSSQLEKATLATSVSCKSQPLSRLRRDELTGMWPNGLTLCNLLAQALECGFLSSAQPRLDKPCEKLMKLF